MKVENFEIDKEAIEDQRQNPFLLVELNGNGCGLERCGCSPANYISISNGVKGLEVTLTDEEAKELKETGKLEVEL